MTMNHFDIGKPDKTEGKPITVTFHFSLERIKELFKDNSTINDVPEKFLNLINATKKKNEKFEESEGPVIPSTGSLQVGEIPKDHYEINLVFLNPTDAFREKIGRPEKTRRKFIGEKGELYKLIMENSGMSNGEPDPKLFYFSIQPPKYYYKKAGSFGSFKELFTFLKQIEDPGTVAVLKNNVKDVKSNPPQNKIPIKWVQSIEIFNLLKDQDKLLLELNSSGDFRSLFSLAEVLIRDGYIYNTIGILNPRTYHRIQKKEPSNLQHMVLSFVKTAIKSKDIKENDLIELQNLLDGDSSILGKDGMKNALQEHEKDLINYAVIKSSGDKALFLINYFKDFVSKLDIQSKITILSGALVSKGCKINFEHLLKAMIDISKLPVEDDTSLKAVEAVRSLIVNAVKNKLDDNAFFLIEHFKSFVAKFDIKSKITILSYALMSEPALNDYEKLLDNIFDFNNLTKEENKELLKEIPGFLYFNFKKFEGYLDIFMKKLPESLKLKGEINPKPYVSVEHFNWLTYLIKKDLMDVKKSTYILPHTGPTKSGSKSVIYYVYVEENNKCTCFYLNGVEYNDYRDLEDINSFLGKKKETLVSNELAKMIVDTVQKNHENDAEPFTKPTQYETKEKHIDYLDSIIASHNFYTENVDDWFTLNRDNKKRFLLSRFLSTDYKDRDGVKQIEKYLNQNRFEWPKTFLQGKSLMYYFFPKLSSDAQKEFIKQFNEAYKDQYKKPSLHLAKLAFVTTINNPSKENREWLKAASESTNIHEEDWFKNFITNDKQSEYFKKKITDFTKKDWGLLIDILPKKTLSDYPPLLCRAIATGDPDIIKSFKDKGVEIKESNIPQGEEGAKYIHLKSDSLYNYNYEKKNLEPFKIYLKVPRWGKIKYLYYTLNTPKKLQVWPRDLPSVDSKDVSLLKNAPQQQKFFSVEYEKNEKEKLIKLIKMDLWDKMRGEALKPKKEQEQKKKTKRMGFFRALKSISSSSSGGEEFFNPIDDEEGEPNKFDKKL